MPSVSVVINTYNRHRTLRDTLSSLRQLTHPHYEVVVVNGPSTDGTDALLAEYAGRVRVVRCPVRSLSVSRNMGICAAAGDIIAFLDDDAVADPRWLDRLVSGYDRPEVAAVGGFVYDHTGYAYQCKYNMVDRFGVPRGAADLPDPEAYNTPGCREVLSTIGTNSSFRADALRAVGGFDEAYCYYLDETDVCLRLVDAGYTVRILPDALIYHRYAASFARTATRVPTTLYPSAVCRAYYTVRNGLPVGTLPRVLDELTAFQDMLTSSCRYFRDAGVITAAKEADLADEVRRGLRDGVQQAVAEPRKLISPELADRLTGPFRPFPAQPRPAGGRLRLALCTGGYPPADYGGVARWTADLAAGLTALGHEVHVFTLGGEHPTVNYEDGVWVHRLVPSPADPPAPLPVDLPAGPAAAMRAVYREVLRVAAETPLDLVAWHVWENVGLACLDDPAIPTALFVESAFGLIRPYKPDWQESTEYGRLHVAKMVAAETHAYLHAPLVVAPSRTILAEYDELAGERRDGPTVVVPLGTPDPGRIDLRPADGTVQVLYVGRLENRKGIDLLLAAVPGLAARHPQVRFVVCGEDVVEGGDGTTHRGRFQARHAGAPLLDRVTFTGKVSDAELVRLYAGCDLFVAPSRFESFGLIYVEAMARGKPVVALAAGGATEVVRHGVDGLLADPDDPTALEAAIDRLLADPRLRAECGRNARQRYLQRYTVPQMAAATAAAFQAAALRADRADEVADRPPGLHLHRPHEAA